MADVETKAAPAAEEVPHTTTAGASADKPETAEEKKEESGEPEGPKYEFGVKMSCGGCSGAIDRVLKKLEGVKKHEVSLDKQTAVVWAEDSLSYKTVLSKIHGTKKTVLWGKENGHDRATESEEVPAAA